MPNIARFVFVAFFLLLPSVCLAWQQSFIAELKNGGAYVVSESGKVLFSHRANEAFVPASTTKIATAACALDELGPDSQFITEFYLTKDKHLAIKGYGDPTVVSEELRKVARILRKKGLKKIKGLILDDSYFANGIHIDGKGTTERAYDAMNGALVANFNSIFVRKFKNGTVASAEPQTPLTPTAARRVKALRPGKYRINIGQSVRLGAQYFGELFSEFLVMEGITIQGPMRFGTVPKRSKLYYKHKSKQTVEGIVEGMMEYSTNFTANQLMLIMGGLKYGAPATVDKGLAVLRECLANRHGISNFEIHEAAGLSRKNKVSPKELVKLLKSFVPYKSTLYVKDGVFLAKTGTLTGVNTYAGYIRMPDETLARFAILINDDVPFEYKFKVARSLYKGLTGRDVPKKDSPFPHVVKPKL